MGHVVLVSRDTTWALAVAERPAPAASPVHVVLLDSAAAAARSSHPCAERIREALDAGVVVSVHDEAALRRGMGPSELVDGVKTVDLDEIADVVAEAAGAVMWL